MFIFRGVVPNLPISLSGPACGSSSLSLLSARLSALTLMDLASWKHRRRRRLHAIWFVCLPWPCETMDSENSHPTGFQWSFFQPNWVLLEVIRSWMIMALRGFVFPLRLLILFLNLSPSKLFEMRFCVHTTTFSKTPPVTHRFMPEKTPGNVAWKSGPPATGDF